MQELPNMLKDLAESENLLLSSWSFCDLPSNDSIQSKIIKADEHAKISGVHALELDCIEKTNRRRVVRKIALKSMVVDTAFQIFPQTAHTYTSDGLLVVGYTPKDKDTWQWNQEGLDSLGVDMVDDTHQED